MKELTASNLKEALWDTMQKVQAGTTAPAEADAVACQAREILRTVKVQLQVVGQAKRNVPADVIGFAEK